MNTKLIYILIFSFVTIIAKNQQIALDQGIKAGSIWCFPLLADSLNYYYLPSSAKFSMENKMPKFSLLRYIINKPTETDKSITEADGGALLNFLVEYETPVNALKKAEEILKLKMGKKAVLKGPIVFKKANYSLVSSVLNDGKYRVLAKGDAPVLEGSALAFSFKINPADSKLLLESFKTGTSDISIVFDFTFSGFTDSFNALLEVDWAKTHLTQEAEGKLGIYTVGLEAKNSIDNLLKTEAIKLTTTGENQKMEALIDRIYSKVLYLLFEPIQPDKNEKPNQQSVFSNELNNLKKDIQNIIPFSLSASYKRKSIKREGKLVYDFSGRSTDDRHHFVSFNIGDIYSKYGNNPLIFNDIPLYDIAFQQRQVTINLDGEIEREFANMLKSVSVIVKKTHQDSTETIKEVFITKDTFKNKSMPIVNYLGPNDTDRLAWLDFEYKTIWQLKIGGIISQNWEKSSSPIVSLNLPYKYWKINFEGNLKKLAEQNIAFLWVQISYKMAGQLQSQRVKISPNENIEEKKLEVILPNETEQIDYTITWIGKDGSQKIKKGVDQFGLIVIDNL